MLTLTIKSILFIFKSILFIFKSSGGDIY